VELSNSDNSVLFEGAAAPRYAEEPTLLDIVDHVLNAGVVLHGSIVISLAGVDLVYLGLNAVLTSVDTALKHINSEKVK
jgi:hypothetical protein